MPCLRLLLLLGAATAVGGRFDAIFNGLRRGSTTVDRDTFLDAVESLADLVPRACADGLLRSLPEPKSLSHQIREAELDDLVYRTQGQFEGLRDCVAGQVRRHSTVASSAFGTGAAKLPAGACEVCIDSKVYLRLPAQAGAAGAATAGADLVPFVGLQGVCVEMNKPFDEFTVSPGMGADWSGSRSDGVEKEESKKDKEAGPFPMLLPLPKHRRAV